MAERVLRGTLSVGLLTSPHIRSFNERISVDGWPISDEALISAFEAIKGDLDAIRSRVRPGEYLSPIGVQAALALKYFDMSGCNAAILECGKGARFDDVPNVLSKVAAINTIFLEHTRELGSSVEEIAVDKAHIMKPCVRSVIIGPQSDSVQRILEAQARLRGCELFSYGSSYHASHVRYEAGWLCFDVEIGGVAIHDIRLPLLGRFQARNCALALALARALLQCCRPALYRRIGVGRAIGLSDDLVRRRLADLSIPGRMQVICREPFVLLDACINRVSCDEVRSELLGLGIDSVTAVVAIPDDKDYSGVIEGLRPIARKIVLTRTTNRYYRFSGRQLEEVRKTGIYAEYRATFSEAYMRALDCGLPIVILGTTALVSDVLNELDLESHQM